jgi:hypothetical protein
MTGAVEQLLTEVLMLTQPNTKLVQWQDFKVKSEADAVMEIAQSRGWKDCEIFGYGDMIAQPLDSKGWKLYLADLYQYSIPAAGVARVLEIIQAGVQIKGVVIADDERSTAKPNQPARWNISLPTAETLVTFIGKALALVFFAACVLFITACAVVFAPLLLLGAIISPLTAFTDMEYDPKLVILVDDGTGNTVWISVLTWYE